MRTKKSPIEELRLRKIALKEECNDKLANLQDNLDYAKGNFGTLLLNSTISSTKSGISDLLSSFTGKKKIKEEEQEEKNSALGTLLLSFTPIIWEVAQPMLIGLLVKKSKSIFLKKKKKKNKQKTKKVSE